MARSRTARNRILILGGGFAGAYVARLLGRRGATIVSPENFMLYTPTTMGAYVDTLKYRGRLLLSDAAPRRARAERALPPLRR